MEVLTTYPNINPKPFLQTDKRYNIDIVLKVLSSVDHAAVKEVFNFLNSNFFNFRRRNQLGIY